MCLGPEQTERDKHTLLVWAVAFKMRKEVKTYQYGRFTKRRNRKENENLSFNTKSVLKKSLTKYRMSTYVNRTGTSKTGIQVYEDVRIFRESNSQRPGLLSCK